jgi:CheY-like chemotaxis protein
MEEKKRVFIADDDQAALMSLQALLRRSGFEVCVASDGKDVLEKIKSFKPQVILLDMLMPNTGGLEICEMLNNDADTQGIPVMIISGLSGYTDIKKAYRLGIIGYITKPYDFESLLQEIHRAIAFKEGEPL